MPLAIAIHNEQKPTASTYSRFLFELYHFRGIRNLVDFLRKRKVLAG